MPTLNFWKEFLDAFSHEISTTSDKDFSRAWESSGNRTTLYEETLLKNVSKAMNLNFQKEEFKVDYTFCTTTDDSHEVPKVFIESENVASSAHHEMRKLCCLHAPLKILITCAEWSNKPGDWKHGGSKDRLLNQWASQIHAHNKVFPTLSITGVIIAEWNQSLRYYAVAFDHFGEIIDNHRIIFEREIN